MIERVPVLMSTVAARPGESATRLPSAVMWHYGDTCVIHYFVVLFMDIAGTGDDRPPIGEIIFEVAENGDRFRLELELCDKVADAVADFPTSRASVWEIAASAAGMAEKPA